MYYHCYVVILFTFTFMIMTQYHVHGFMISRNSFLGEIFTLVPAINSSPPSSPPKLPPYFKLSPPTTTSPFPYLAYIPAFPTHVLFVLPGASLNTLNPLDYISPTSAHYGLPLSVLSQPEGPQTLARSFAVIQPYAINERSFTPLPRSDILRSLTEAISGKKTDSAFVSFFVPQNQHPLRHHRPRSPPKPPTGHVGFLRRFQRSPGARHNRAVQVGRPVQLRVHGDSPRAGGRETTEREG